MALPLIRHLYLAARFAALRRRLRAAAAAGAAAGAAGLDDLIAAGPAPNLEQARARFELFAQLSVKLVRDLAKRDAAFQSVRIFSAPGGDRPREWIQLSEPAANPFATATPKNAERTP